MLALTQGLMTTGGNTVALLPLDGPNGSTVFTDLTGKSWTGVGNAQISTALGTPALLLDGALDGLQLGAAADLNFGAGPWTIEVELYVIAHTNVTAAILATGATTWQTGQRILRFDTGNRLSHYPFEGGPILLGSNAFPTGQWRHVALCKGNDGVLRLFRHGVLDASAATSNTFDWNAGGRTFFGYSDFDDLSLNGYARNLRISRVARYATGFTPPSGPFALD